MNIQVRLGQQLLELGVLAPSSSRKSAAFSGHQHRARPSVLG
jgi:hypothetical protein